MVQIKHNNNYLNCNIFLLKCALLWPLDTSTFQTTQKILQHLTAVILFLTSVAQFMTILKTTDLRIISSAVDVFTLTASALYKQQFIVLNMKSMRHIVKIVHNDFHERPLVDTKDKTRPLFSMNYHLRYAQLYSKIHVLSAVVLAVVWCLGPLLLAPKGISNSSNLDLNFTTFENTTHSIDIELNGNIMNLDRGSFEQLPNRSEVEIGTHPNKNRVGEKNGKYIANSGSGEEFSLFVKPDNVENLTTTKTYAVETISQSEGLHQQGKDDNGKINKNIDGVENLYKRKNGGNNERTLGDKAMSNIVEGRGKFSLSDSINNMKLPGESGDVVKNNNNNHTGFSKVGSDSEISSERKQSTEDSEEMNESGNSPSTRRDQTGKKRVVKYSSLNERTIMPMQAWTGGFSYINSPWYEIMFAIEFWAFLLSCCIYLSIDAFYFSTIYICCGQLELIQDSMKNMFPSEKDLADEKLPVGDSRQQQKRDLQYIRKREPQNRSVKIDNEIPLVVSNLKHPLPNHDQKEEISSDHKNRINQQRIENHRGMIRLVNSMDNAKLAQIANLHDQVLRLVRFLEQTFTSTIIVDFFHAVTSLSFALFHFQSAQGVVEFMKMYVFLFVCILHQFLNNYFGEIIKYWQVRVSDATYQTPWYLRDAQFRRSIQIITARTRKPIMMNGLKMYILCLASFIEFMKRIFSYYTVLKEVSK